MITIQAKKHDNFSLEFKCGFNCKEDGVRDDFSVNAWIFVPNSLDINPENYGKKQFYRDIKSNVRLMTPVYLLKEMADESSLPLTSLRKALEAVAAGAEPSDVDAYQYHLKMFSAIIVALFLGIPYLKAKYFTKQKDLRPSDLAVPINNGGDGHA